MKVPEYGLDFLRDALQHRESVLCLGRKNAKSAITACYLLARMVGPLYVPGWRGCVVSVTKAKAGELKQQMADISRASNLEGLTFLRSPAPGRVEADGAALDILSADASSGHAAGFDDAVIDETGLLDERHRGLVNGIRSSTSARNGRVLHLSILGSGPYIPELIDQADDPAICVHLYQADDACDEQDEAAWRDANPGLGTIKSIDYMRDRSRLAARNRLDAADFRSHDLNIAGEPSREMIVTPAEFKRVLIQDGDDVPERLGGVVIGLDCGGSASMTAATLIWPATGRVEVRGAFPDDPDLIQRGQHDGVGARYEQLHEAGELLLYRGRTTPVVDFLRDLADDLQGVPVLSIGFDRFRDAEVKTALSDALLRWPAVPRGTGASAKADGSSDVLSFQRQILEESIKEVVGVGLMLYAIAESALRSDGAGNHAVDKARARGRIDALQCHVIASGLCERWRAERRSRPRRKLRHAIAG